MSPNIVKSLALTSDAVLEFLHSTGAIDFGVDEKTAPIAVKASELFSSSLGFSGPQIKGAIVVTTYSDALSATNPQREFLEKFEEADHADWIGEMANQIVGNLKRLMATHGVNFTLGTPVVVGGSGYRLLTSDQGKFHPLEFQVQGHKLKIHLSVELSSEVDLSAAESEDKSSDQAAGGDAFLF